MNVPDAVIRALLDAGLASLFDPNPVVFRAEHEVGVRPLRSLLRRSTEAFDRGIQHLRRHLVRDAFLCGCLDYTEHQAVEHLIIGHGVAHGRTTRIAAVQHVVGAAGNVGIPQHVHPAAQAFVLSTPGAELVVFHHHPVNPLNAILDNLPIASSPDRHVMLRTKYLQPLMAVKGLLGLGGVRYYVGEAGFVREFRVPGILQTLDLVSQGQDAKAQ